MDLYRTIRTLHEERKRLERLIESLEHLHATGKKRGTVSPQGRRGRKGMSADERQRVSERMKKYWSARRSAQNTSTTPSASASATGTA